MMQRVLVANRGEIACRVMRTCRQMGIRTIAVYSDADREAPHVHAADEAVRIGPADAASSYLNMAALIGAARHVHADAVHPGYGFLSENPAFAEACVGADLTWIGPTAEVIRRMGSKTAARDAAVAAGVPVVPGHRAAAQDDTSLLAAMGEVGLPALVKATAGGGGKGMRVVRDGDDVLEAVRAARREALHAFGDGELYVERLLTHARHIEVQIVGDRAGRVIHLGERDCSLQRRHQKVVEEAPAGHLAPHVRHRICDAAVRVAASVGYTNAGTVEFLLVGDDEDARFYFLEVNTRLQVEHPVTEAVTGLDLVRLQLQIAAGEPLALRQQDVTIEGHAVECRIYAEDSRRLLPQTGRLLRYREPSGSGIRVDAGVLEGQTIGVHYDALIAKLIVRGESRDEALGRADTALLAYEILGVRHNIGFLRRLLTHPVVAAGDIDTRFIEDNLVELIPDLSLQEQRSAAALAVVLGAAEPSPDETTHATDLPDPWDHLGEVRW